MLVALYSIVHASLSNADVCLVATDFSLKMQGTGLFSSFPSQRPLSMVAILNSSAPTPPDLAEGIQTLGFLAHGALFVIEVIVNLTPLALLAALVVCIIGVSPPSTDPTSSVSLAGDRAHSNSSTRTKTGSAKPSLSDDADGGAGGGKGWRSKGWPNINTPREVFPDRYHLTQATAGLLTRRGLPSVPGREC